MGGTMGIGCGGDDAAPAKVTDGGSKDSTSATNSPITPTPDAPAGDTNLPDTAPPPPHGKVMLVHASPGLPALRICYSVGVKADLTDQVMAPVYALPDDDTASAALGLPYPGFFPGTGGPQPDVADLSKVTLVPYLIFADQITTEVKSARDAGTEKKCTDLLGPTAPDGGLEATKFIKLGAIPAGTFAPSTPTLVALVGCLPQAADPTANAAKCGSDYDVTNGNVGVKIYKALDRTVADATKMGVQILQASSAFQGEVVTPLQGTLVTGFATVDGGTPLGAPVTAGQVFGDLKPDAAAPQTGLLTDQANTAVYATLVQADGGLVIGPSGPINVALPLPIVKRLSIGPVDAGYFANGANFTFILVGDPAQPTFIDAGADATGPFNPRSMHWIALPNDPVLPTL